MEIIKRFTHWTVQVFHKISTLFVRSYQLISEYGIQPFNSSRFYQPYPH